MPTCLIYNTSTGTISGAVTAGTIADIEANTPSGCSALPVDPGHPAAVDQRNWRMVGGVLTEIVPTSAELLAEAQATQSALIQAASASAQTSGFTSSALGSAYTYPSGLQDQANLNAVATLSTFPGRPADATYLFWCTSSTGVSTFVPHTAAQIQQVGIDALNAIMAEKSKQWTLTQQIEAATTVAAVQAITW